MPQKRKHKQFSFTPTHKTLKDIMTDHDLATLGDAYTNLLYSLYLSIKTSKPTGAKASSQLLSRALKQAGLRRLLPSRLSRHELADAAEAFLVYGWLHGHATITGSIEKLSEKENIVEGFSYLLADMKERLNLPP